MAPPFLRLQAPHPGATPKLPGAATAPLGADDDVHARDSVSQVSSSTSSVRRRKNALAEKVRKEAMIEKHRREKEKEELEERERKLEEEQRERRRKMEEEDRKSEEEKRQLKRKKDDIRRQDELAQCDVNAQVSEIEAVEEGELQRYEMEAKNKEEKGKE